MSPDPAAPRRSEVLVATLLVGTASLAWSLRLPPGDPLFAVATLITAVVWIAGTALSGPLHRIVGDARAGRTVLALGLGVLLVGVFVVAGLEVARVPVLAGPVRHLLRHADAGSLPIVAALTALNGVAEELFFRGALYAGLRHRRPVLTTTVIYALVTAASGILLLVVAAGIIGAVTALLRRVTGGVIAPAVTHVTWSLGMLLLLPPLLDAAQ